MHTWTRVPIAAMLPLSLFLFPVVSNAQTAGGANSRYIASNPIFQTTDTCLQTLTGMSGKTGRVLLITTNLHDDDAACTTTNVFLHATVNGVNVQSGLDADFKTNGSTLCFDNSTAQWWLDIDAAGLVNQPLTICIKGSVYPSGGIAFGVSTSAVQEAK